MKVRFYHWWIYRLFVYTWNPIFRDKPKMLAFIESWIGEWRQHNNGGAQ